MNTVLLMTAAAGSVWAAAVLTGAYLLDVRRVRALERIARNVRRPVVPQRAPIVARRVR